MTSRIRTLVGTCAAVLLFAAAAAAQLPAWSQTTSTPTSVVNLEQSLCVVRDGNTIKAFSCFTRQWASITTLATPTVTINNEHMIVRDGATFYGWSPRSSQFAAVLTTSPTATLLANGSPQTWHSVVTDGNDVHIYWALTGQWTTLTYAAPPAITITRWAILINDGTLVWGLSSYYQTPVPLIVPGATIVGAWGWEGLAQSGTQIHGFSAIRNTWASAPLAGTPTVTNGSTTEPGFVLINDGTTLQFFSGHTGGFTTVPAPVTSTVSMNREVAVVVDGYNAWAYSGMTSTLSGQVFVTPPVVTTQFFYAMIQDAIGLTPFAAPSGAFGPQLIGNFTQVGTTQMDVVTAIGDTAPSSIYSSYTNTWIAPPTLNNPTTYVTSLAVIMVEPGVGYWALSGRGTSWFFQPGQTPTSVTMPSTPSGVTGTAMILEGQQTLHVFNPHFQIWRAQGAAAPITNVNVHFDAMVARDSVNAYGYSILTDKWAVEPLSGAVTTQSAQVQSAMVREANTVHVYSGVGQTSTDMDFPDFWRTCTIGARLRIDLAAEPYSWSILAASTVPAAQSTPYGDLLIDPNYAYVIAQPFIPASGIFTVNLQVPNLPALAGFVVYFQSAIYGPTGFYLTNETTVSIF